MVRRWLDAVTSDGKQMAVDAEEQQSWENDDESVNEMDLFDGWQDVASSIDSLRVEGTFHCERSRLNYAYWYLGMMDKVGDFEKRQRPHDTQLEENIPLCDKLEAHVCEKG
jgi:hypothetical protein